MSLEPIQKVVAEILKSRRSEHSFVGGSTVFNRSYPRRSADIDIYVEEASLNDIAFADVAALRQAGLHVEVEDRFYGFVVEARVTREGESTLVEWNEADRDRFFPVVEDELFGWTLHPADLAVQKLVAAASRRAARDVVDILLLDRLFAPLSALAIAAPAKLSGSSPTAILDRALRNGIGLPIEEYAMLALDQDRMPFETTGIKTLLADTIDAALTDIMEQCSRAEAGFLYVRAGSTRPQPPRNEALTSLERRGISERGIPPIVDPDRHRPPLGI